MSIVSDLQARGWAFDEEGTLQPPSSFNRTPLIRESDSVGDRYFLDADLADDGTAFDVEAWWRAKEARDAEHLRFLGL